VVICDSKVAYAGGNLATLERAVLGFLAAGGRRPATFAGLLETLAVPSEAEAAGASPEPWRAPETVALPVAAETGEIDSAAERLLKGLAEIGARPAGIRVNVASAARLNGLMDAGRNKAGALFALTADILAELLQRAAGSEAHITMDRHGGRRYYAGVLSGAFPMATVEALEESPESSRYRLAQGDSAAMLSVREKCESWSLPTALASMAAKYVREVEMMQLNAWFQARVGGLRATAGYGLDAWRFLDDVAGARAAAGVPDGMLLRGR
jgi:hypothetical protein